ncbi:flagellar hook protein FlgE, partial [Stutzerimonas stutzeri]
MSFNIGLSGLRAASKDLNVTGNNIANAGTVGFKQSRAEFSDVYAASMGVGKNPVGSGVLLANVAQQFNQGNINYTQNALDLAINGSGFFQVSNNGALSYTRAGYFGTDKLGNIVDNFGYNLQGYTVDDNGNLQVGAVGNLQIKSTSQDPKATSQVAQTLNLNSTNTVPVASPFDPADPTTYNSSTSTRIYDTQGNSHVLTQYFAKDAANDWTMYVLVDGKRPNFDVDGVAYQ